MSLTRDYICVIGSSNVDYFYVGDVSLFKENSNRGHMLTSPGGVGRNTCENLIRLGNNVEFITAIGDDFMADYIKSSCRELGIGLDHSIFVKDHTSSVYIAILDENSDIEAEMCDVDLLDAFTPQAINKRRDFITKAKVVVCAGVHIDAVRETLKICEDSNTPVFVDPISIDYAREYSPIIGKFHTIKPNKKELEILADMKINSENDIKLAIKKVLQQGTQRIFVSLGTKGCVYADQQGNYIFKKIKANDKMVNATGGGDAFMSALVHSYMHDFNIETTLNWACAAGEVAVLSEKTVSPEMSPKAILNIIRRKYE